MEKVAGIPNYNAFVDSGIERSPMVRGHHSSINKAVEAHRNMVEQRQSRQNTRREMSGAAQAPAEMIMNAQMAAEDSSVNNSTDYQMYENTLIESPSTQAKMASIQSFQTTEPERPLLGEPVPKGSYLDIEV